MAMHRILEDALHEGYRAKGCVHGFVRGQKKSIVSNAQKHIDSQLILNVDLETFFPSIHFGRVRGIFAGHPFKLPHPVACYLAQLCCWNGALPQGAPTSPILSNLACRSLDQSLVKLAHRHKCAYTRYADDISISTKKANFPTEIARLDPATNITQIGDSLRAIIEASGFSLNPGKSRLLGRVQRQEVTGLTVNDKVNVSRAFVRNIRAALYKIESNGYESADADFGLRDKKTRRGSSPSLESHISGKLNFLSMVKSVEDPVYVSLLLRAHKALPDLAYVVKLRGDSAKQRRIAKHAVYQVIALDTAGIEHARGTAFALAGWGFITNEHVLIKDAKNLVKWLLVNAADSNIRIPIDSWISRSTVKPGSLPEYLDIAILKTSQPSRAEFLSGSTVPSTGDDVMIAGFPAAHVAGAHMAETNASVTTPKVHAGATFILVDKAIVPGNSGGPMLDEEGFVVGVATYSGENTIAPNSAISILGLKHFKT